MNNRKYWSTMFINTVGKQC